MIQATNFYGLFTNMRWSLTQALALAAASNRTLVYAPMSNCNAGEGVDDALQLSAVGPVVESLLLPADLSELCGGAGQLTPPVMYLHSNPSEHYGNRVPGGEGAATRGDAWLFHNVTWRLAQLDDSHGLNSTVLASDPHACVGMHSVWADTRLQPQERARLYAPIQKLLLPSARVTAEVDAFLSRSLKGDTSSSSGSGSSIPPYVGVHLRNELRHMASRSSNDALGCKINTSLIMQHTHALLASTGATRVLLATDNVTGKCTRAFVEEFKPVVVVSGVWNEASCREASFVQEVMGRGVALVGSGHSTFSITISEIMVHRYNRSSAGRVKLLANNGVKG